jgi:glutathione S-transferase
MFVLFGEPRSGSTIIEAVLEETGAPFRVETVGRGSDNRFDPAFETINPLRQVPALQLADGSFMTESGAIAVYLADTYPDAGLAPRPADPRRGPYLRWMFFLAANVYISDLRIYYPDRYVSDPRSADHVKEAALKAMAREWDIFAEALGTKPFILGDRMSAADIYASVLATWNVDVPGFFARHPNMLGLYKRVSARPGVARVWARHEMYVP